MEIARRYLIPRQAAENGIKPEDVIIEDQALSIIISRYTLEAGLRNLEREIAKICRKMAIQRAEGGTGPVVIRPGDLVSYLGPEKFSRETAERVKVPGVAIAVKDWVPTSSMRTWNRTL